MEHASQDDITALSRQAEKLELGVRSPEVGFLKGDPELYVFDPINSETQIRILVLEPPSLSDSTTLHGSLITAALADKPLYEAISYTWGDPVFPERLYLPSGSIHITTNLASALHHLRFPDRPRRFWIDAVCINQRDNNEKSHQVGLMSQIFKNSQSALAWLGSGQDWDSSTLPLLKEMSLGAENLDFVSKPFYSIEMPSEFDEREESALAAYSEEPYKSAIFKLLELPWFQRLWIVQEFVLSPQMNFFLGYECIHYKAFQVLAKVLYYILARNSFWPEFSGERGERIGSALFLCLIKEEAEKSSTDLEYFIRCVEACCSRFCADDRDYIFGLMGLYDSALDLIKPDYTNTIEDVYLNFAYEMLKEQGLYILHLARRRFDRHENLSTRNSQRQESLTILPSWVPDWRCTMSTIVYFAGSWGSATSLTPKLELERSKLPFIGIKGVEVDTVKTQQFYILGDMNKLTLKHLWIEKPAQILQLMNLFKDHLPKSSYPTGEDLELAFAKTIVLNNRLYSSAYFFPFSTDEEHFRVEWNDLKLKLAKLEAQTNTPNAAKSAIENISTPYVSTADLISLGRTFFITSRGYIGVGPADLKEGDAVVIFDGGRTPFILGSVSPERKPTDSAEQRFNPEKQWEIIGDCYLHGFMDDEVDQPEYQDKRETFWIT